uniref:NADH-ubiquinone oxidoreductase chain 6 n=1 Tax=Gerrhopilus ceylonicus TaxID=3148149 RepID=A0PDM7_9SAUR|nr:NADH dehydrogenase subunit 6 [Gerrhopilus mirus]
MMYMAFVMCFGVVIGFCGLCCSILPYMGVVCLVVSSVFCCGMVAFVGSGFVSLLLFIVYLGGMMVVFAYSVAMAVDLDDLYMDRFYYIKIAVVFGFVVICLVIMGFGYSSMVYFSGFIEENSFRFVYFDSIGVSLLYSVGGACLVLCVWSLLLVLFVVLEVVRGGIHGGGLRSV